MGGESRAHAWGMSRVETRVLELHGELLIPVYIHTLVSLVFWFFCGGGGFLTPGLIPRASYATRAPPPPISSHMQPFTVDNPKA